MEYTCSHADNGGGRTMTAIIDDRFAVTSGSQFAVYIEDYIRKEAAAADGDEIRWLLDPAVRSRRDWHTLGLRYMERQRIAEWSR